MSTANPNTSFEDAFQKLVSSLSSALHGRDVVSLTPDILEPFRHLGTPDEPKQLRSLAKLFDGKAKDETIRLTPRTFYAVYAIVLQFPNSRVQERLLYNFLDTIILYKNENAAAAKLSRIVDRTIEGSNIRDGRRFVCKKLSSHAFEILQRRESGVRSKRIAARTLMNVLTADHCASIEVINDTTTQCMHDIVHHGKDYVLRLLVIDLARAVSNQDRYKFDLLFDRHQPHALKQIPSSQGASSIWLGAVVTMLGEIDVAHASKERSSNRVFRLTSLEFDDGSHSDNDGNILAVFSDCIVFILPTASGGRLSIIEVPFASDIVATSIDPRETDDAEAKKCVIKVTFSARGADRYFQGTRKAIDEFQVSLSLQNDLEAFAESVRNCSANIALDVQHDTLQDHSPTAILAPRKQSLMFTAMDWNSEDDTWDQEGQKRSHDRIDTNVTSEAPSNSMTDSPVMITNRVGSVQETERMAFRSNSMTGQSTQLYERMRGYQGDNLMNSGLGTETPRIQDAEEYSFILDDVDQMSPTLRLSQPNVQDMDKGVVTKTTTTFSQGQSQTPSKGQHRFVLQGISVSRLNKATTNTARHDVDQASIEEVQDEVSNDKSLNSTSSEIQVLNIQLAHNAELENTQPSRASRKKQKINFQTKARSNSTANWNRDLRIDNGHESDGKPAERGLRRAKDRVNDTGREPEPEIGQKSRVKKASTKLPVFQVADDSEEQTSQQTAASVRSRRGARLNHNDSTTEPVKAEVGRRHEQTDELLDATGNVDEIREQANPDELVGTFLKPTLINLPKGAKIDQPIVVPSASNSSSEDEMFPNATSHQPQKPIQLFNKRTHSVIEQSASPPDQQIKRHRSARAHTKNDNDNETGPEIAAQDSYPSETAKVSIVAVADASFASKLDLMVAEGDAAKETGMSASATRPQTPFGDRKKFVARVNAAKSSSPGKSVKKVYGKRPRVNKPRSHNFSGSKSDSKRQIENAEESPHARDRNFAFVTPKLNVQQQSHMVMQGDSPSKSPAMGKKAQKQSMASRSGSNHAAKASTATQASLTIQNPKRNVGNIHSPAQAVGGKPATSTVVGQVSSTAPKGTTDKQLSSYADNILPTWDSPVSAGNAAGTTEIVRCGKSAQDEMSAAQASIRGDLAQLEYLDTVKDTGDTRSLLPGVRAANSKYNNVSPIQTNRLPSKRKSRAVAPRRQEVAKPHVVHFGKNGPTNQGKPYKKMSARRLASVDLKPISDDDVVSSRYDCRSRHAPDSSNSKLNPETPNTAKLIDNGKQQAEARVEALTNARIMPESLHTKDITQIGESISYLPQNPGEADLSAPYHSTGYWRDSSLDQAVRVSNYVTHPESSMLLVGNDSASGVVAQESPDHEGLLSDSEYLLRDRNRRSKLVAHKFQSALKSELDKPLPPPAIPRLTPDALLLQAVSAIANINELPSVTGHQLTKNASESQRPPRQNPSFRMGRVVTAIPLSDSASINSELVEMQTSFENQNLAPAGSTQSATGMVNVERLSPTSVLDAQKMPPPPPRWPKESRSIMVAATNSTSIQDTTSTQNPVRLAKTTPKRAGDNKAESIRSLKRRKPSHREAVKDDNLPLASTPVPLNAMLCNDLKELEKRVERQSNLSQVVGFKNSSDIRADWKQPFPKSNRNNTPELTEDTSSAGPDFEGTPVLGHRHEDVEDLYKRCSPQAGLRNALNNLTEAVLLRVSNEEDAMQSRLLLHNAHIRAVLDRSLSNWSGKVKYEKDVLLRSLRKDKELLDSNAAILKAMEDGAQERKSDEHARALIDEKKTSLLHRLKVFQV